MDLGAQQEPSLTMPIPMSYGSIHESSKFGRMGGPSIHMSGSSSMNRPPVLHNSAVVQPSRPSIAAPPAPPPPPPPPPAQAPTAANSQAQLVEESSAPGRGAAGSSDMGTLSSAANSKKPVKYRECLKNHAANIGGHALDGCGEFMPSGEEGSLEALKCAACGCHRNFHRREVEGEVSAAAAGCGFCTYSPRPQLHSIKDHESRRRFTPLAALQPPHPPLALPPPSPAVGPGPPRSLAPLHVHMQALQSPPDMAGDDHSPDPGSHLHNSSNHAAMLSMHHHHFGSSSLKKRFRTKFSSEQKDRMFNFAEKLGWRIQKHDESAVHQFCADVGVKRHVFKVWMHNNKNTFAKKISPASEGGVAYLDNGGSSPTTSSGMQP